MVLTGLFLMAGSACFLTEPRSTKPGMAAPTMGWELSRQLLIKRTPREKGRKKQVKGTDYTFRKIIEENFPTQRDANKGTRSIQIHRARKEISHNA